MKKILVYLSIVIFFSPLFANAATFCPTLTQDLWYGSCDETIADSDCARHVTGDQVSQLQHFLKDYFHNPVGLWMSGFFGNKTKNYVIQFQSDYDVPATGRVRPLTRAAIQQACNNQTTVSPPPPSVSFSANPTSGTAPLGVTFRANGLVGTLSVNFGDG